MKRLVLFTAAVLVISSMTVAQEMSTQIPPAMVWLPDMRNCIVFKQRAFVVGDPILVAGPSVTRPSWSPTGQFLVYEQAQVETNILNVQGAVRDQKPTKPQNVLCVYSVAAGRSAEIMRFDTSSDHGADVYWIPGSDRAMLHIRSITVDSEKDEIQESQKLYILDASNASIREFSPWQGTDKPWTFEIFPSPTQPYAFVGADFLHHDFTPEGKPRGTLHHQTVIVSSSGGFAEVHVPDDPANLQAMWSQDGTRGYVVTRSNVDGKSKQDWYNVSLSNGETQATTRPTDFYMGGGQVGVISVRDVMQTTSDGKATHPINALWLETLDPDGQSRLLLAGDASNGEVNKTVDCASYLSQGSLFVRPISEVPFKMFEQAVIAYNRSLILNQVRQAGIALIMYSADFDDIFPSLRSNISQLLGPYLRDPSLLDGFVYTYPGGPATNIANPGSTQIGYIDGADGRAVVYADGHSKWIPKPR